jgi:hypothetical protein
MTEFPLIADECIVCRTKKIRRELKYLRGLLDVPVSNTNNHPWADNLAAYYDMFGATNSNQTPTVLNISADWKIMIIWGLI